MPRPTPNHPQVAAFIDVLKQLFRTRGIPHRVIAEKLAVTERTVKRWFAGKGLTLQVVEDLCNVLGLTFTEFCEFAKSDLDVRPAQLSSHQERTLLADPSLLFLFGLLHRGWLLQEIQNECKMSEAVVVGHLVRLEKLRLVELMPSNRVRLLFARNVCWTDRSAIGMAFQKNMKHLFDSMDFTEPNAIWSCRAINLTEQSFEHLQRRFGALTRELQEEADADRDSNASHRTWYSVLVAARAFDPASVGDTQTMGVTPLERAAD
jgi:transcriptional regulator with XRE-family HTH domain